MPEQPSDPLHYDMRIPPPPDPSNKRDGEKESGHHDHIESNTAGKNGTVRGDQKQTETEIQNRHAGTKVDF